MSSSGAGTALTRTQSGFGGVVYGVSFRENQPIVEVSKLSIEKRIQELGLQLPKVPVPAANYANAVRMGNAIYLSGTVPARPDGTIPKGKVGADVSTEEAAEHARLVGLNILAILKGELGSLDRAKRVIKLLGMVNAVPDFREHSRVINGCSDLFEQLFGAKHARSAIGVGSLPFGITVEIEAIIEVADT